MSIVIAREIGKAGYLGLCSIVLESLLLWVSHVPNLALL